MPWVSQEFLRLCSLLRRSQMELDEGHSSQLDFCWIMLWFFLGFFVFFCTVVLNNLLQSFPRARLPPDFVSASLIPGSTLTDHTALTPLRFLTFWTSFLLKINQLLIAAKQKDDHRRMHHANILKLLWTTSLNDDSNLLSTAPFHCTSWMHFVCS